jgi:hypothetical protein
MAAPVYVLLETPILFADSAQTPNVQFTLSALASLAGRVSAQYDRGAAAHAGWYEWRFSCQLTGTNVVGAAVELYIATSDGAAMDGQVGTVDAALATDKRNNLRPMGTLVVDQVTTNVTMTASGEIYLPQRYLSVAVWNATTLPFKTDTAVHRLTLTPFAEQAG